MKKWPLTILGVLILVQFAIPFTMIQGREKVLREGELFRFITRPIDPADPFQGRYVRLGIQNDYVTRDKNKTHNIKTRTPVYAIVETNSAGFAYFSELTLGAPRDRAYLKTRYRGPRNRWAEGARASIFLGDRIDIPFDRFYMDEAKAPRAEKLAREATRNTNCWVEVRILNGKAVIEDVFAGGQSLRDLASEKE